MCSADVARQTAIYALQFCKAILNGIRDQVRHDGRWHLGMIGIGPRPDNGMTDAQLERRVERLLVKEGYEITNVAQDEDAAAHLASYPVVAQVE